MRHPVTTGSLASSARFWRDAGAPVIAAATRPAAGACQVSRIQWSPNGLESSSRPYIRTAGRIIVLRETGDQPNPFPFASILLA